MRRALRSCGNHAGEALLRQGLALGSKVIVVLDGTHQNAKELIVIGLSDDMSRETGLGEDIGYGLG